MPPIHDRRERSELWKDLNELYIREAYTIGMASDTVTRLKMILRRLVPATKPARAEFGAARDDTMRLVAENSGDVIFRFGPDGRVRYMSPSIERIYGHTPMEIFAMGGTVALDRFVHKADLPMVHEATRRHFAGDLAEVKLEFRIIRSDGVLHWVETNCNTVTHPGTAAVTDIVVTMRDVTDKKALQLRIAAEARTDGLTGVANRRAFDEALDREWRRVMRDGSSLSLLILDVDHFKTFNDANGHQVGDDCLRTVARTIANSVHRAGDLVARYGGEEFAIILACSESGDAIALAEQICSAVRDLRLPHPTSPGGANLSISIGAATAKATDGGTIKMPEGLLQAADLALYKAKANGRNRVETSLVLTPNST